ncbi:hypothetical protein HZ326_24296, partial [Fusarium oxysporum f. sp. albedinis]
GLLLPLLLPLFLVRRGVRMCRNLRRIQFM